MPSTKTKLIQTRVPEPVAKKLEDLAEVDGVSPAAWLRRLVLQATGMDGQGRPLPQVRDRRSE